MSRPVVKKNDMDAAAVALFAEKGVATTSIRDIAKLAGVTEGAFYRHYLSKEDMAWKLYCKEVSQFASQLKSVIYAENLNAVEERISAGIAFVYRYYHENTEAFTFIMLTQHHFPQHILQEKEKNPYDLATELIASVLPADKDAVLFAGMILGMVMQPVVMHRYGRLADEPMSFCDTVIASVLKIIERSIR